AVSRGVAAADSASGPTTAGSTDADGLLTTTGQRIVLHTGSRGALVAAAQRRLDQLLPFTHLTEDGVFGPLTRGAVLEFQRSHGLTATGSIDVRTWAVMFKAPVVVMGGPVNAAATAGASAGGPPAETTGPTDGSSQSVATDSGPSSPATDRAQPAGASAHTARH